MAQTSPLTKPQRVNVGALSNADFLRVKQEPNGLDDMKRKMIGESGPCVVFERCGRKYSGRHVGFLAFQDLLGWVFCQDTRHLRRTRFLS